MTEDGRRKTEEGGWPPSTVHRPPSLIDCDVHVRWASPQELLPYLPAVWHARLLRGGGHTFADVYPRVPFYSPHRGPHKEAAAPEGGRPGSDPATVARDWLDRHGIERAVVHNPDAAVVSTWGDVEYPTRVASAVNDWLLERWLGQDARFLGSIVVATQDVAAAVREVERSGNHPQVVQVLLPAGTRQPYGHPYFHPIFAAAAERGLQVAIHTGTEGHGTSNPAGAAGWPRSFPEFYACQPQAVAAHLTSLITEGVFVKFPELRVTFLEAGAAWAAPYLWRLDKNFKGLRSEAPWLTELPSIYARRHLLFGTKDVEPAPSDEQLWLYLREMWPDETLVYASGYPEWDLESPEESRVASSAPGGARQRILAENAVALYAARAAI